MDYFALGIMESLSIASDLYNDRLRVKVEEEI